MSRVKSGYTQKKYFKLKDGASTFRLLPSMEELGYADKSKDKNWSQFYSVHYGYKNTAGKLRVFQSTLVMNRKSKMVEVPDAAVERIETLKAKLAEAKESGQKAVVEKLGPLVSGQKPMYNVDKNHYINAIDEQGNIGVLKLRHTAKQALDVEIKKLEAKGIDPIAITNGRLFVFSRSGTGLQTAFKVDVAQELLNIEGVGQVNRDKISNLTPEQIAAAKDQAADLGKLYKKVSPDDVGRIVKASDLLTGISPVIDELFDTKGDASGNDEGEDGDEGEDTSTDDSAAKASAAAAYDQAAQSAAEAKAKSDAQTAAKVASDAKIAAEVKAKNDAAATAAASTPTTQTQAAATQTTAEAVSDMTDADFLKSLGL